MGLQIIYEDAELLVVNKPAGLVCHPTKAGPASSLVGRLRAYLGGDGAPRMMNRLDRETSGLVLVAKSTDAAAELGHLWAAGRVRKGYETIVHGAMKPAEGSIDAPIGPASDSRVAVKNAVRADGVPAVTHYQVRRSWSWQQLQFSWLAIRPLTGRKHQIRVHLQFVGHPVVGDKLYGQDEDYYLALVEDRLTEQARGALILPYQALHAASIEFTWRGGAHSFSAPAEDWFTQFLPSD